MMDLILDKFQSLKIKIFQLIKNSVMSKLSYIYSFFICIIIYLFV